MLGRTLRGGMRDRTGPGPIRVPFTDPHSIDGWLYVSVGDKGVPGAIGPDGRKVQLKGVG